MTEQEDAWAISNSLYKSADLYGQIGEGHESRRGYITIIKLLCVFVAGADGELTQQELKMMQTIFMEEDIDEVVLNRHLYRMQNDPDYLEAIFEGTENSMKIKALNFAQLDLPYKAEDETLVQLITIVCQTVIAANDDLDERELQRLSSVTSRLREFSVALEQRFGE